MKPTTRSFKGAIHLHTTYSHDGVLTLEELARFIGDRGYDFMAVTEHSQDMTAETLADLEQRSAELSNDRFLVIPGLEFSCTATIHILGIGVTALCASDDPSTVIDHIHAHHGLAVLAHPSNKDYPIDPSWVAKLDGCEIWNNRQGKWLPQLHAVRKFGELQKQAPGLLAFAGLDLHGPQGYSHVAAWVEGSQLDRSVILGGLKQGSYAAGGSFIRIPSNGSIAIPKRSCLAIFRAMLNGVRWLRNKLAAQ